MRIAHLVLAHKNPQQLERMLDAMAHPAFDFFIHIDKKTESSDFAFLFNKPSVYPIVKRTPIHWGGWGTIQAIINGFEEITPSKRYDYINVMSAQDFPLKPAEEIYQYILARKGTEFMTCESIEDKWKEAAARFHDYSFINWRFRGKHRLERIANKLLPSRKYPHNHEIVGRANWFTLTQEACVFLLRYLKEHPEVPAYFRYTWGADEFIFSIPLYNSDFRPRIVDNLMYVDWSEKKARPKLLRAEDYQALTNSGKLFARKFDMEVDEQIIGMLESYVKG